MSAISNRSPTSSYWSLLMRECVCESTTLLPVGSCLSADGAAASPLDVQGRHQAPDLISPPPHMSRLVQNDWCYAVDISLLAPRAVEFESKQLTLRSMYYILYRRWIGLYPGRHKASQFVLEMNWRTKLDCVWMFCFWHAERNGKSQNSCWAKFEKATYRRAFWGHLM